MVLGFWFLGSLLSSHDSIICHNHNKVCFTQNNNMEYHEIHVEVKTIILHLPSARDPLNSQTKHMLYQSVNREESAWHWYYVMWHIIFSKWCNGQMNHDKNTTQTPYHNKVCSSLNLLQYKWDNCAMFIEVSSFPFPCILITA